MVTYCFRTFVSSVILVGLFTAPAVAQPTIVFDYTYDTNNFFPVDSQQRTTLEAAAARLTSRLTDSLTAITPGGSNTWTAIFDNPTTGATVNLVNPTIAANEIRVFVGAQALGGNTLGFGGFGAWSGGGSTEFLQSIGRGQFDVFSAGSTQTDFGLWGGTITFDSATNWHFGLNAPASGQFDFLSVALHELGHVLGFGTAPSWDNLITGTTYNGSVANALAGGPLTTTADKGHWAEGTTYLGQEAAMDPTIMIGMRKEFTELDFAGLDDLGWQVVPVPEPASIIGVVIGVAGAWGGVRRLRRKPESVDAPPVMAC